ncbi:MAG: hemerythrin family protein [Nitrosomonadales bacterium]|nr:hemerythrin family protein [Nitrosomonadales bacterium]
MSLTWREQLSVGNDVIDSDHKHLIEIINSVGHNLGTKNRTDLFADIDHLLQYSREHFLREEKIAYAAGYTQILQLKHSHELLCDQLFRVKQELESMTEGWSEDAADHFTQLMRDWLMDHVIKEDLPLKQVLQKHPPGFNPA